jgi:Uma2 family endonuclease
MSAITVPDPIRQVQYPDCDGQPMSDNTVQFTWISILKWSAESYFRDDPNVFVAGDHLIYPVEGRPDIRQAPAVYVAFGPRKGDRGSYKVWEEGGIFPQVVFEVWSPNNRQQRMEDKREFYEIYGAEEYYIVYPEFPAFVEGWRRDSGKLIRVLEMDGFTSPRLGFRFVLAQGELTVFGLDGRQLRSPTEIAAERDVAEKRAARLAAKLRELGVDPEGV